MVGSLAACSMKGNERSAWTQQLQRIGAEPGVPRKVGGSGLSIVVCGCNFSAACGVGGNGRVATCSLSTQQSASPTTPGRHEKIWLVCVAADSRLGYRRPQGG